MVNLTSISTYPNLFNSTDVDAIKELADMYPDVANDSIGLIKSDKDTPKYGFKVTVPTGIEQYEYFSGHLGNNTLFKYLNKYKFLYFKNGVMTNEVLSFEAPPLIEPTIDALCQLATEVTGNTDTSSLREVLEILEPDELGDYEISTANLSMIDKSIRIGLMKESTSISEDILKLYGTRSNTKTYQNIEGVSTLVDTLIDNDNNLVEMIIEFNSTGLVKEIGYALSTQFALDAPEGTTAQDNFQVYLERHESHKTSVNDISYNAKEWYWMSEEWQKEIILWEQQPRAVHGATIITAGHDGTKLELVYGLD